MKTSVEIVRVEPCFSANEQEALADIRWRLRFPADAERDRAILAAIGELLNRGADGSLTPRDLAQHRAVIWWEHHIEE